jgi:NADH:quinone reductase (non-electrogenic)
VRAPAFRTRVTELFGIDHPILMGGLMWLADATYVAAAVNAGCMGFMTAKTFRDPGRWRDELAKCGALTGGRPFGVNLYFSQREGENDILTGHLDLALKAGVRHFETAGMPPAALLPTMKEAGAVVMHKTATVRHAVSAATKYAVDAVVVVGAECGGHPGLDLVGSIVQGVLAPERIDKPVVIGGGIGHGRQIAAVLGLGADAVLLGTRMLVASEIWSHDAVKRRVLQAGAEGSRLVLTTMRNTYRVMDNETARAVARLEAAGETAFDRYRPLVAGTLTREAYESGDTEKGLMSMGQSAVFADAIEPVEAIVDRLIDQAITATARLDSLRLTPSGASA